MVSKHSCFVYAKPKLNSLIRDIAKGKRKAQEQLYDEYSPLVMGICMRYMKDYDLASDVFQESFVKIYSSITQVEQIEKLGGWIRRVTVNTALDYLKSAKTYEEIEEYGLELSDQYYADLMDRLSSEVILSAVNRLPDGYRVIFNMSVIDGFSHKDISQHLGISESTSRSQLTYAKRALKKYLNEIGITKYEQVI